MTTQTTSNFAEQAYETASKADQPKWLADARAAAWKAFELQSWPSNKDEEWMRTDIRTFHLDKFAADVPSSKDAAPTPLLTHGVELAGRLSTHQAVNQLADVDSDLASRGILFMPLDRGLAEHGDRLRPYIERRVNKPTYDKFASLNSACWRGGTLLFVPKGVTIDRPLHTFTSLDDGGVDLSRTLVVLEEGAEATLLMETGSTSASAKGLHCGSLELIVEPNAKLRYVNLQNWSNNVWHFAHQKATVDKNAQLQWTIGALGAKLAKVNQQVAMTGPDAEAQVNGVMFTQGRQHLCYNTLQHHQAPYCRSDLLYKSALQDRSRTVWRGMIKVDVAAQRTDAYQRNDNLMLAATARADSIPGLEIEADDVRCTHGSTSGRVDDAQVFYAMSRGYTRVEAIRMIVAGFFQQVFDRISIESVRDALGDAISKRVQDLYAEQLVAH